MVAILLEPFNRRAGFQKTLGRVEVHVQPGRYPDELAGLGVPDMAPWSCLLGEETEVFKVNPVR
jgi:hypothetical protein